MSSKTKYEFFQDASLSQKLAYKMPEYANYAGSDPEISQTLALLQVLHNAKKINIESGGWKLVWDLLNEQRKAAFATSEKVNEITKMGMQMPKKEGEFFADIDADNEAQSAIEVPL